MSPARPAASMAHICGVEFLAVGSPARLDLGKCRVLAATTINWRLAVEGRYHPAGEVVLGFGTESEVDAALARARAESAHQGGLHAVEYSAAKDEVRVTPMLDVTARGRKHIALGAVDPEGWYIVWLGTPVDCNYEATRLRRIRAGRRSQCGLRP